MTSRKRRENRIPAIRREPDLRRLSRVLTALTLVLTTLVTICAVLIAAPVQAITYGTSDESKHPYAGAVLFDYDLLNPGLDNACSGTLIRNDTRAVFLTAAHCDPAYQGLPSDHVAVSFDNDVRPVTSTTKLYYGRFIRNLKHTKPNPDPYDIAVVVFDQPIPDITPAQLPTQGQLDQMLVAGQLPQADTVVGYGDTELQRNDGQRRSAVSGYLSLGPVFLNLDQNHLRGYGGTCGHDSGGPVFLGSGSTEQKEVVAITYSGDLLCTDTGQYYRIDTPSAREFLSNYVTLP
jgi:Trypsin